MRRLGAHAVRAERCTECGGDTGRAVCSQAGCAIPFESAWLLRAALLAAMLAPTTCPSQLGPAAAAAAAAPEAPLATHLAACRFDAGGYSPKCGPTYCDLTFTNNGVTLRVRRLCFPRGSALLAGGLLPALVPALAHCIRTTPFKPLVLVLVPLPRHAASLLPGSWHPSHASVCASYAQGYQYKGAYDYKPTNLTDFVLLSA